MEIREAGGTIKNLTKNKFFLVALLVVIVLAFYQIVKSGGGKTLSNSGGGMITPSGVSGYPSVGENTETVIQSVNQNNELLQKEVLENISSLGSYLDIVKGELSETIKDGNKDINYEIGNMSTAIKDKIDGNFADTNGYIRDSFDKLASDSKLYHQNVLDNMQNMGNYLGDKIDSNKYEFRQQFTDLAGTINNQHKNTIDTIKDSVSSSTNQINDGINRVLQFGDRNTESIKNEIDDLRKQNNAEHSLLSQNVNAWSSRLYGGGK